jgi:ferric-dicitrate binding protein FerR (iron transport regulator)
MENEQRPNDREPDAVAALIRAAGRRVDPPETAYREVFGAAYAAFRAKATGRGRRRVWGWAAAASVLVAAILVMMRWDPVSMQRPLLASVDRVGGSGELATADGWRPLAEAHARITRETRLRTLPGGRAALIFDGGDSLRLAAETELQFDGPRSYHLERGTVYLDVRASLGAGVRITTPAGTVRDLGTQFELHVVDGSLRLRVREGQVEIERAGQQLTGTAGEQLDIDSLGNAVRSNIAPDGDAWRWAEVLAPAPDIDGRPASELLAWVARETGKTPHYADATVRRRAASVVLHGYIRHLAPLEALDDMLATTDLEYVLSTGRIEIRARANR